MQGMPRSLSWARALVALAAGLVAAGPAVARFETGIGRLDVERLGEAPCAAPAAYAFGEPLRLRGDGFEAAARITLSVGIAGGMHEVLAVIESDGRGRFRHGVQLPSDPKLLGLATLEAVGAGPGDESRILYASIRVAASFEEDGDGDGVPDLCDLCAAAPDPAQTDRDRDGHGDACDPCPDDPRDDHDGDGLCAERDPCPDTPLNDADGDGVCEPEDNCPELANPDQADDDYDGVGNLCQPLAACLDEIDNDGDGLVDRADPGCRGARDRTETDWHFPCDDGRDNDADGKVDFPSDPGCKSPYDVNEAG